MKKIIRNTLLFFSLSILATGCKKEENEGLTEMKDKAKVVFLNVTTNAATTAAQAVREIAIYPFYNGVQFNNFPIKFPFSNGYKAFDPGTLTIRLDTAESQANNPPGPSAKVLEFPMQVQADNYYSIFSVGTAQNVDTFIVRDDVSLPAAGKARLMFYNLSPDAGPVDIVNSTNGQVVIANLGYKERRSPIEMNPATYRFQINAAGTTTVLRASRDLIIDANSVYTVWTRGLRNIPVPGSTFSTHPLQLSYHAIRWTY